MMNESSQRNARGKDELTLWGGGILQSSFFSKEKIKKKSWKGQETNKFLMLGEW
jgi:hypothetical protein